MPEEISTDAKGTCFVVMGFDKKTDFETGRTLDLNKSYKNIIKPAVEAAGLKCLRADEIVHTGVIDLPMYQQLLQADVVVADLSTSNKNAFYELGVRHALRPFTTVIIAEDGIKPPFPFDLNHIVIRQYHHMGGDIGFDEVMRFREVLTKAIVEVINKKEPRDPDSPVYTFLKGLKAPQIADAVQEAVQQASKKSSESNEPDQAMATKDIMTHSMLMQKVDEAQKNKDWVVAKSFLSLARQLKQKEGNPQEDTYLLQRLALITYKSKYPAEKEALEEAQNLLKLLEPDTSNDTETLGLWGAIHKRLWQLTRNVSCLNQAIRAYERGFYLRNDYYNGINFAFLLNVRANETIDPAEAVADYVQARRARHEVLSICQKWLEQNPAPQNQDVQTTAMKEYFNSRYWVIATLGEAYLGLGDEAKAQQAFDEAYQKAPEPWMRESTAEQIANLKPLLSNSPLRFVNMAK